MSPPDTNKPMSMPRPPVQPVAETMQPVPGASPSSSPARLPAILSAGPTASGLLRAFARRWLLAIGVGLVLGGSGAAALWLLFPSKFTAEQGINIERPPKEIFQNTDQTVEPLDFMRTQASVIKSPLILGTALRDPKLAELPGMRNQVDGIAWLDKMIAVDFKAGQSILRVVANGNNAQEVAAAVNAVVKAYQQEETNRRQAYLQKIKDAYAKGEESLRKKREALGGMEDPKIAALERDLQLAQFELKKAEAEMSVLKLRDKTIDKLPAPISAIEEYARRDDLIVLYYKELGRIDQEINEVANKSALGARDPMVRQKVREKENLLAKIDARRLQITPQVERQVRDKAIEDNRLAMERLQEKIASSKVLVTATEVEGRKSGAFGKGDTPEMRALRDDISAKLEVQNKVGQEIQIVEMEGKQPTWVVPLGNAEPPTSKVRDRQIKMAGVGAGGFFALGVLGVAWLEWRSRRVASTSEITQGLGIPLIGAVPSLPARARRGAVTGTSSPKDAYWQGRLTEAVDALRTLLLRAAGDGPKVVMVTSALGGEGKTSLAAQLAVSLARAWRKTLLIDGDVRQPAAHQLFNLPVEPGLCEVLRGEMEAGDVIQATTVSRLWLMSSGRWDAHAIQALAQEGSSALFDQLKDQYDFIVLDSSPVLPVADALVLGQHVDAVLLAVRCGESRLPAVYAAHHRLSLMGIPVLGAVAIAGNGEIHGLEVSYPRSHGR